MDIFPALQSALTNLLCAANRFGFLAEFLAAASDLDLGRKESKNDDFLVAPADEAVAVPSSTNWPRLCTDRGELSRVEVLGRV